MIIKKKVDVPMAGPLLVVLTEDVRAGLKALASFSGEAEKDLAAKAVTEMVEYNVAKNDDFAAELCKSGLLQKIPERRRKVKVADASR